MNFTSDANIFIGCNERFVHLSPAEKFDETLALIQYWTSFTAGNRNASLQIFSSPAAVPVIANVSKRLGKEINCIILPAANDVIGSLNNIAHKSTENTKNSLILLSNNAFFPEKDELFAAARRIQADRRALLIFAGEKNAFEDFPRLVFSLENQPLGSVPKSISGLSRTLATLFAQTDKGESIPAENARRLAIQLIGSEPAARTVLRGLYEFLESANKLTRSDLNRFFSVEDRIVNLCSGPRMTGAEIERSSVVDLGLYLIAPALLPEIATAAAASSNKMCQEVDLIGCAALLDAVGIGMQSVRSPEPVEPEVQVDPPANEQSAGVPPEKSGYSLSASAENRLRTWLLEAYGLDKSLIKEKVEYLNFIFELFFYHFGPGEMNLGRAATPVELLGRHLDNFGGMINAAAIARECQVLSRVNDRGEIRIRSTEPAGFPEITIPITNILK